MQRFIFIFTALLLSLNSFAQVDRKPLRRGNRDFRKENYKEADIYYRKALNVDSTSLAANYNFGNNQYKLKDGGLEDAMKSYQRIKDKAISSPYAADYLYNLGDLALAQKDYKTAVDAFRSALLLRPGDVDAKENYIYAKLMLENQQQNQDQNQQGQNQQDRNRDQNQDQNQNQQNQDRNQQNQDRQDSQQNQQNQNEDSQQQPQQSQISPQAAQQMLQAIQAKEKETQEKVKKEKAEALKSRQKEKNW